MIVKKSASEIDAMAVAGDILVRCMDLLATKVRPGVTTADLDRAAERFIRSQGATPAFKGYRGFPGSICASPNHMVVHGIPGNFKLAAGDILVRCMDLLATKIRPGVTTAELDQAAERFIRSQDAVPAFKGYRGFPGSICASPNHMVVHGIPGSFKLGPGDIISVDIGVIKDGWVADAARTFPVGDVSPVAEKLLEVTRESLFKAAEQCVPGNRLGDVGYAVQSYVEDNGFSVVRSLVGHGIGRSMHDGEAVVLDVGLHRVADVAEPVAGHALLGSLEQ
ncbi:MAG: methionyl aminopeptidase [Thermoleophilaceae bacterium]|nr:methionyl aminopeptidase [Thermoleophilaceae bacterium]